MEYRYACADFTFPLLPHGDVLKLIGMMGFDGVDVGLFEERSHLRPSGEFYAPAARGAALRRKAEDAGIAVADVFLQSAFDFQARAANHPSPKVRAEERTQFCRLMEYARAAGSGHITCLPGVAIAGETYGDSYRRALEELAWRVERAKECGLVFAVEAHLGSLADTPEKAEKLAADVPGLTLTLDYTHFTKMGVADGAVAPLMKYASHFHARGAAEGRLQTVVCESAVDYDAVVAEMVKTGYDGFIGIEYTWQEWEGCNKTDNVSESILLMRKMKDAERKAREMGK